MCHPVEVPECKQHLDLMDRSRQIPALLTKNAAALSAVLLQAVEQLLGRLKAERCEEEKNPTVFLSILAEVS